MLRTCTAVMIGEQLRVVEECTLPKRSRLGLDRAVVNIAGSFAGLTLGLVLAGVMSFRQRRTQAAELSERA